MLRRRPGFACRNPAAFAVDSGYLPIDPDLVASVPTWTRASLPKSYPTCTRPAPLLPILAPTSPQPQAKQPIPPSKCPGRPGCAKAGTGMGSFRCGLHLLRSGPGQERSGTTQPRSETGADFAARSGFSRSGNRCRPCTGSVSADATGRKRSTARVAAGRSPPEPASVRVCAGQPAPDVRPGAARRLRTPLKPSPGAPWASGSAICVNDGTHGSWLMVFSPTAGRMGLTRGDGCRQSSFGRRRTGANASVRHETACERLSCHDTAGCNPSPPSPAALGWTAFPRASTLQRPCTTAPTRRPAFRCDRTGVASATALRQPMPTIHEPSRPPRRRSGRTRMPSR